MQFPLAAWSIRPFIRSHRFGLRSSRLDNAPGAGAKGLTLIEILVVIAIIALLAAMLIPAVGRGISAAKTAKTLSNLRQLHQGATLWASENNGNYPVTAEPSGEGWPNAIASTLYPEVVARAGTPNTWVWNFSPTGYEGTAFRSPNAERGTNGTPSFNKFIASYGYNSKFTRTTPRNLPARFAPSQTVMFADNDGKSHTLAAVAYPGYGALNPRNGASADYAGDGKAAVIYLDGHSELLDAVRCAELASKPNDPFWGKAP